MPPTEPVISAPPTQRQPSVWALLGALGAYFVAMHVSVLASSLPAMIAPVSLATGLSIWLVIRFGNRMLLPLVAAELAAMGWVDGPAEFSVAAAVLATTGKALSASLGAWLYRRGNAHCHARLGVFCEPLWCAAAALIAPVASAGFGVAGLLWTGAQPLAAAAGLCLTAWTNDAIDTLFVLSVLVAAPDIRRRIRQPRRGDGAKVAAVLVGAAVVLGTIYAAPHGGKYLFAVFALLLVPTAWFGAAGARVMAFLVAGFGHIAAELGHSPFAGARPGEDFVPAHLFLLVLALVALLLPALQSRANLLARVPLSLLLGGWGLSAALTLQLHREHERGEAEDFSRLASLAKAEIVQQMTNYVDALRGGASFLTASPAAGRQEWLAFAETLDLPNYYTGLNALGVVYAVTASERTEFLQKVRREGSPDFAIRDFTGAAAVVREESFVLTYLTPERPNAAALGLDVALEPVRRSAAEAAREHGVARLSGPVTLRQDPKQGTGLTLWMPVYRFGAPVTTVAERRAAFVAWITAPFTIEHFLRAALQKSSGILDLSLFAGPRPEPSRLVFSSRPAPDRLPGFELLAPLELHGHRFTLGWNRGPAFGYASRLPVNWLAMICVIATVLLTAWVLNLRGSKQEAETLVEARTAALRDSEARWKFALEGSGDGLWDWTVPTDTMFVTERWRAMVGAADPATPGARRRWEARLHPADLAASRSALEAALAPAAPAFSIEQRLPRPAGGWTWVMVRGLVVERDAAGQPLRLIGTLSDITPRRETDLALASASTLLERTGRMARVGGWSLDLETGKLSWSAETYRIHEVDPSMPTNVEQGIDYYAPEARPIIRAAVEAAITLGTPWDLELPFVTAKGRALWVRAQGSAELRDGQVVALHGTFQDITERRQAQETLRRSEERLRLLIHSSRDAMLTLHPPAWRFVTVNPAAIALFQAADAGELQQLGLGDVAPEAQPDGLRSAAKAQHLIQAALADRAELSEWTLRRRDGSLFSATVLLSRTEHAGESFLQATVRDITAQKLAEVTLRETARRMTQLYLSAPTASCLTDLATGEFIEVNDSYLALVERPRSALVGYRSIDIGLLQSVAERERIMERAAREGRAERAEIVLLMPDGRAKDVGFSTAVVELAGRRCALTYAVDITAQKAAETERRSQSAFLSALNETTIDLLGRRELPDLLLGLVARAGLLLEAPLGTLLLHEGDALVLRACTVQITGLVLGQCPSRDEAPLSWQTFHSGQTLNIPDYASLPLAHRRFGAFTPHAVLMLPIFNGARTVGVLTLGRTAPDHTFTAHDIRRGEMFAQQAALVLHNATLYADALREARDRTLDLLESERRLSLAVETAGLGFWIRAGHGAEFWASARWRSLFDFALDEAITTESLRARIHPEDRDMVPPQLFAPTAPGDTFEIEFRVLLADGEIRWVASRGRVDDPGAGQPLRVHGVAYDITRRRVAELEAARHRSEITHLSRVNTLGELSGSLAHELNQPLAIILSNAQAAQRLLAQDPPDLAEVGAILVDIVGEDHRAGLVIQRLRALLKQEEIRLYPIHLDELIAEVLRLTRSDLIGRGITVRCDLAENLPAVAGDKVQFLQILLNLILNGAEAMEKNRPRDRRLVVRTAVGPTGTVRLAVSDLGCGLPPGDPEQIFRPFFTTKKTGLGLGLGICRTIVGSFHGRLWAEPNADRGATLHIELPALASPSPS